MLQELRATLCFLLFFTLLTGVAYPLAITAAGQRLFPHQAGGSLFSRNGVIAGSELIGQTFTADKYFHGRPSAAGSGYDAANSSGSNLAPTAPDFIKTVTERVAEWRSAGETRPVPVDLVTASGSGLDPDLSPASAAFQATRVATARGVPVQQVQKIIADTTVPRLWGFWGEVTSTSWLQIRRLTG